MLKEKDYLGNIAEQCISKSNKLGSTDVSVMVMHSVSEDVSVRNRKLDGSTKLRKRLFPEKILLIPMERALAKINQILF